MRHSAYFGQAITEADQRLRRIASFVAEELHFESAAGPEQGYVLEDDAQSDEFHHRIERVYQALYV